MNSAILPTRGAVTSSPDWDPSLFNTACPPLRQLSHLYSLYSYPRFLQPEDLNALAARHYAGHWRGPAFIAQSALLKEEARYYEQIIAQEGVVPTRQNNWHDFFNALVWLQFPRSKSYLNQLHVKDIDLHGVHPRTARRHRLTHFDECGVVLAVSEASLESANELLEALALHDWKNAFLTLRSRWGSAVQPFVFGHANLEMLLNPFMGLTGKWFAVKVGNDFTNKTLSGQLQELDVALKDRIKMLDDFALEHILRPLPLLGIPGWYQPQNEAFYADESYFRPQRKTTPWTTQLPLR